jgi:hypothetical protein
VQSVTCLNKRDTVSELLLHNTSSLLHTGPQYNLGEADPVFSLIISTGPGTQIYAVTKEAHTAASCTDLASFPLTDLGFVTIEVKCAGPGVGYFLHGPAEVDGELPVAQYTMKQIMHVVLRAQMMLTC